MAIAIIGKKVKVGLIGLYLVEAKGTQAMFLQVKLIKFTIGIKKL